MAKNQLIVIFHLSIDEFIPLSSLEFVKTTPKKEI